MSFLLKLLRWGLVLGALGAGLGALMAFFGFAVPVFDLLNHAQIFLLPGTVLGLIVVLMALRGRMRIVAALFVGAGLVSSASLLVPEFIAASQPRPAAVAGQRVLTMMTHNLFGRNYDMDRVFRAIEAAQPDIIVLQEYFGEQSGPLSPMLKPLYPYSVECHGGKRANIALYSKIAFEQVLDGACPSNAYGTERTAHIIAEFAPEGMAPFTVMTSHMDWPYPIVRQHEELDKLSGALSGISGPLILAGDFNSTPWAYALRNFASLNGLNRQTFALLTYPLSWYYFDAWRDTLPFLGLDHVFTRGGIIVHELGTGQATGSDHLPVVFKFSVTADGR